MTDLRKRSCQKELLDSDGIPFADIVQNMRELDTINTWLGGHAITLAGVRNLLQKRQADQPEIVICEIGCGGGDNLKAIEKWCARKKIKARFIGIDINAHCIGFAGQQHPAMQVEWVVSDYEKVDFGHQKPDIIFSSLFCHHFTENQLVAMLGWMKANASLGFFINDLHRHPLAYYSIKSVTALFSKSYLVKNDAPLSVARGFTKKEWLDILTQAGINNAVIKWKWAFRHLIVCGDV